MVEPDGIVYLVVREDGTITGLLELDPRCVARAWSSGGYTVAHIPGCHCPAEVVERAAE
jgi:hypothetical protein